MQASTEEVVFVIIAVIVVLLFLAILFMVSMVHYANKQKQMRKEQEDLLAEFEKQLLQARLEMQEQTFEFISQEIHDNVGQILSVAKVQLALLNEAGTFNRELIGDTKHSVSKAMAELRDLARSLSSDRIRSFNLSQSIEEEVYRLNKTGSLRVTLQNEGTINLKDEQKLLVFRVVQECLQNAVKHAQASLIRIDVQSDVIGLRIILADDGIGFDTQGQNVIGSGMGLRDMQQRIALIGGTLGLISKKGSGTTIEIKINYN